jgi:hypothetical protein
MRAITKTASTSNSSEGISEAGLVRLLDLQGAISEIIRRLRSAALAATNGTARREIYRACEAGGQSDSPWRGLCRAWGSKPKTRLSHEVCDRRWKMNELGNHNDLQILVTNRLSPASQARLIRSYNFSHHSAKTKSEKQEATNLLRRFRSLLMH